VAQQVEHLPSKRKALSTDATTTHTHTHTHTQKHNLECYILLEKQILEGERG
jgi:hypothetical protein